MRELPVYPVVSAVYFLVDGSEVVYVGQTRDLRFKWQISQHKTKRFTRLFYIPVPVEDLDRYEMACIRYFSNIGWAKYNQEVLPRRVTLAGATSDVQHLLGVNAKDAFVESDSTPRSEGYFYKYPRPSLTVDCVVFGFDPNDQVDPLKVLLIKRKDPPFELQWALPGGFVEVEGGRWGFGENLEEAAKRELGEESGVELSHLEQLYTFGAPNRDPRGRVVSVSYYALVRSSDHTPKGSSDALDAVWRGVRKALRTDLAFDHKDILKTAITRLQGKIRYEPVGFNLLPKKFTLADLRVLYEGILRRKLDVSNFRKKVLATKVLEETGEFSSGPGRPAKLYRFDKRAYQKAVREGFSFEI